MPERGILRASLLDRYLIEQVCSFVFLFGLPFPVFPKNGEQPIKCKSNENLSFTVVFSSLLFSALTFFSGQATRWSAQAEGAGLAEAESAATLSRFFAVRLTLSIAPI